MRRIPALLNPRAGHATAGRSALQSSGVFDVMEGDPRHLAARARRLVQEGTPRILVAGGDGTVATVAEAVGEARTEIAILPCGTLNHLARDLGLPIDLASAARVAQTGGARPVDAATVNSRVFLNTSAVGASVAFIRARDRFERLLGYHLASVAAGLRMLIHLPLFPIALEVDGASRRYLTPLVVIAVGEREFKLPSLGGRAPGGRSGLHVLVVRRRSGARTLALALAAAARGVRAMAETPAMDAFLVEECRIEPRTHRIALDGEIVQSVPPLVYRHLPGHLRIVVASGKVAAHVASAR